MSETTTEAELLTRELMHTLTELGPTVGMRGTFTEYDNLSPDEQLLLTAAFSSMLQRGIIAPGPCSWKGWTQLGATDDSSGTEGVTRE